MKARKTTFGELKQGDQFALGETYVKRGDHLNIKVAPAVICDASGAPSDNIPFNVISLMDGRVRTFRDEEPVWVGVKEEN